MKQEIREASFQKEFRNLHGFVAFLKMYPFLFLPKLF